MQRTTLYVILTYPFRPWSFASNSRPLFIFFAMSCAKGKVYSYMELPYLFIILLLFAYTLFLFLFFAFLLASNLIRLFVWSEILGIEFHRGNKRNFCAKRSKKSLFFDVPSTVDRHISLPVPPFNLKTNTGLFYFVIQYAVPCV